METENKIYVIGVDGGGTKTEAALADSEGKILKLVRVGPSNPRNVGIEQCIFNISEAIKKLKKGKKISAIFIGSPALEEEFKSMKKKILKRLNFKEKIKIGSDQIIAFRSGTNERNGIVLISGTGCAVHGWRGEKESKVSGWGWLDDEGSGFWVGRRGFQAVFKELDGRGPKTFITKLLFQELKLKSKEALLKKIYSKDFVRDVSLISRIVDEAANRGDRIAKNIMIEAGQELAESAIIIIKKLNFKNEKFPLVLVGGMFDSKIVLKTVKKEIKKVAHKAKFIQPRVEPVIGAIKLAIENLN